MITKLGDRLRKEREARGLSIRDVSSHIFIAPKFIEALEKEDFGVFPSETYLIGFLRTYADFLGLKADDIVAEYKQIKTQTADTPIRELTSITKQSFFIEGHNFRKILYIFLGIAIPVFLIYLFSLFFRTGEKIAIKETQELECPKREKKKIELVFNKPYTSVLDNSYVYEVKAEELGKIEFCLKHMQNSEAGNTARLEILYGNQTYSLQSNAAETVILSNIITELAQKNVQLEFSILDIQADAVKVEFVAKSREELSQKPIVVILEIVQDTYMEWTADGKSYRGIFLSQGDLRILEADTRLDIKIGNGAGVRYRREDMPQKIAGPPGKIVKLSFVKVPDALDPTKYRIEEYVEVVQ